MRADIARYQSRADFLGFKGGVLLVDGADRGALSVAQYRMVDGTRHMVNCKFARASNVND